MADAVDPARQRATRGASPPFQSPSNQSHFPREQEAQELLSSSQSTGLRDAKAWIPPGRAHKKNASLSLSSQPPEVKGFPQSTLIIFLLLGPYSQPVTNPHPTGEPPQPASHQGCGSQSSRRKRVPHPRPESPPRRPLPGRPAHLGHADSWGRRLLALSLTLCAPAGGGA